MFLKEEKESYQKESCVLKRRKGKGIMCSKKKKRKVIKRYGIMCSKKKKRKVIKKVSCVLKRRKGKLSKGIRCF